MSYDNEDHRYYPSDDMARLDACHAAYKDMLRALVLVCKKHRVQMTMGDFESIMEQVGEAIMHETADLCENLRYHGETADLLPDDKIIAQAHEAMVDDFRIKPLNISAILSGVFQPVSAA